MPPINGHCEWHAPYSADTDLRLCRYFQLSEGYFLRLQNRFETMEAKRELGDKIAQITPHAAVQANHIAT